MTTARITPLHLLAATVADQLTTYRRNRLRDYARHQVATRVDADTWLESAGLIDRTGEPTALGWLVHDYHPDNAQGAGWCTLSVGPTTTDADLLRDLLVRLRCTRAVRLGRWCLVPTMGWDDLPLDRTTWSLRRHPDDGPAARSLDWHGLVPGHVVRTWGGLPGGAGDGLALDAAAALLLGQWKADW